MISKDFLFPGPKAENILVSERVCRNTQVFDKLMFPVGKKFVLWFHILAHSELKSWWSQKTIRAHAFFWLANEGFEMFVCVWRIWSEFYITHRKLVFPKHCTKENRCLSRINVSFMYTTSQILFLGRTIRWTSWLVLEYLTTKKTTGTCYYVKYIRI